MSRHADQVLDKQYNRPIANCQIYVYDSTGALATITLDGGAALTNPFNADIYGNYAFNVATDAIYRIEYWTGKKLAYAEQVIIGIPPVFVGPPGSGSTVAARDEGTLISSAATGFNFIGTGVTASMSGTEVQVNIPGGGGGSGGLPGFTPETYGAVGNGTINDTAAFQAMAAAVQAAGGGVISFGIGKTYLVGGQTFAAAPSTGRFTKYTGIPFLLIELSGLTKPLIVNGNGAKIKLITGGKYGVFDSGGVAQTTTLPYYGNGITSYYDSVFLLTSCAAVAIVDLEIDGSNNSAVLGGGWGDTGYQLGGTGIKAISCGQVLIRNVYSHNHTSDGAALQSVSTSTVEGDKPVNVRVVDSRFWLNARLGVSITGGRGYLFQNNQFYYNGSTSVTNAPTFGSAPKSGCDIEPDANKPVRDVMFVGCQFVGNANTGMVAANGDTRRVTVNNCSFVAAATGGSAPVVPSRPEMKFNNCVFAGTPNALYRDAANPSDNVQFADCLFTNDPFFGPPGQPPAVANGLLVDMPTATGINFYRCKFDAVKDGAGGGFSGDSGGIPAGPNLIDCTFIARAVTGTASMSGNTLTVTALTSGSIYIGQTVTVGGVSVVINAFGTQTADPTVPTSGQVTVAGTSALGTYTFSGAPQTVASGALTSVGSQPSFGGRFKGVTEFVEYGSGSIQLLPYNNFSGTDPARNKAWGGTKSENGFGYTNSAGVRTQYPASFSAEDRKNVYWGSGTYAPPSLATGAKTAITTITINGVAAGDKVVEASFSNDLAGARIYAWASAANTVSYYFINENGTNPLALASGTLNFKVVAA